jgi:hypothetical protein
MTKRKTMKLVEKAEVVRYKGASAIREMMINNQFIEAFVHTQLGIEVLLWDKVVEIFKDQKARDVRTTIENSNKGRDKANTSTYELIKWAHFLGALDDKEFGHLIDFNTKRNDLLHGHGKWWSTDSYKEALQHGIRFLEQNNF